MSIAEVEAVLLEMPDEQFDELIDRVSAQRGGIEDEIDPAVLDRARRTMEDIRAGREKTVPAEEVLDGLEAPSVRELEAAAMQIELNGRADLADRLIASLLGRESYDPEWVATLERRMEEIESGRANTLSEEEFFARLSARRHARAVP